MRCIRDYLINLPIRGKLTIFFLFSSVIPLLLISVYSYQTNREQLIAQTYESMYTMNSQLNSNIENRLESFKQISSLIYMDTKLREYLTRTYTRNIEFVEAYEYINNLLYGIMAANTDIFAITLYPYNDTLPSDGLFIQPFYTLASESWFHELQQSYGNAVYSIVTDKGSRTSVFTLARLLNNHQLQYPYSILTIDVKEAVLYSLFEKETATKDIYIVNEDGLVLSAADKSLIARQLSEIIGDGPWQSGAVGSATAAIQGQKSLIVYNSMTLGWKTVSVVPVDYVLKEARQASNRVLFISGISFLIAFALIAFTARYFSKRFSTLYRFIRKVENEDFNFELKGKGRDEIGQLAEAFNTMKQRLKELINEVYKKEILKKESELYALQSQINPHFLYNTLSIISSLAIRNNDEEVSHIVDHLSNFYKTSLNKGKRNILIQKELEITEHYLAIQQMRFRSLFKVHWQTDTALYPYQTLKLMLQPFVENAINHAIWHGEAPLNIIIRLYLQEGCILFEVVDDGAGMTAEQLRNVREGNKEAGYGIRNVHERIQLAYGPEYGVTITSRLGIGTQVHIRLPMG